MEQTQKQTESHIRHNKGQIRANYNQSTLTPKKEKSQRFDRFMSSSRDFSTTSYLKECIAQGKSALPQAVAHIPEAQDIKRTEQAMFGAFYSGNRNL